MTHAETITAVRDVLARTRGLRLAMLFGSVARAAEHEDSDVDVAVDCEPDVDLAALSAELTRVTDREAHVVRLVDPGVPLLEELVRDGIVLHEGVPYAAARWRSATLLALEIDGPWYARMRDAWLARVAARGLGDGQS